MDKTMRKIPRKWIFLVPAAMTAMLMFVALGGVIVWQLWNWLGPELFGWTEITFWQALGLLALWPILFGGWGGGSRGSRMGRRMRERMAERWESMTPEERKRFQQGILLGRCGFEPPAGET